MSKKFITYREDNERGEAQYYILQKAFPNYQARISVNPQEISLCNIPIGGYRLYLIYAGRIDGNFIQSQKDVLSEMDIVFRNMADWYLANRIEVTPKKYLKFKIT